MSVALLRLQGVREAERVLAPTSRRLRLATPRTLDMGTRAATMQSMGPSESGGSFGAILRSYRRAAELTQEELAERAGISARSVSDLERGTSHTPRRDTVEMLAGALGLGDDERVALQAALNHRRGPRPASTEDHPSPSPAVPARHNLPRQLTSFVGRERELRELEAVLDATPLMTLTGAGGVGKTRLAEELVQPRLEQYPDGVWLVELAGVADPMLVPGAVAAVFHLAVPPGREIDAVPG